MVLRLNAVPWGIRGLPGLMPLALLNYDFLIYLFSKHRTHPRHSWVLSPSAVC